MYSIRNGRIVKNGALVRNSMEKTEREINVM